MGFTNCHDNRYIYETKQWFVVGGGGGGGQLIAKDALLNVIESRTFKRRSWQVAYDSCPICYGAVRAQPFWKVK